MKTIMNKCCYFVFLIFSAILVVFPAGALFAAPEKNESIQVRMYMFHSQKCHHCKYVIDEVLPPLYEKYPQLKIKFFETKDIENYRFFLKLEEAYDSKNNKVPAIFIDEKVLTGENEIVSGLEQAIKEVIARGGCGWPQAGKGDIEEELPAFYMSPVYIAFFDKPGCKECDRKELMLKNLKAQYPALVVRKFEVFSKENQALQEKISETLGVPINKRLIAPTIFVGDKYLISEEINDSNLRKLVGEFAREGSLVPWEVREKDARKTQAQIVERFKSFSPLVIMGAGLIDGINPCAFAVLIFFVSYLIFLGFSGRKILNVGISFIIGVYIAYFGIGLGLFKIVSSVQSVVEIVGKIIYLGMAAIAIILGIISLYDYIKIKQGKIKEVKLQLTDTTKKKIHFFITSRMKMPHYVLSSFICGVFISIKEFPCSGQIYLPVITFVSQMNVLKAKAISYLALYNFMFILPLVVVFLGVYHGVKSKQIANVFHKHLASLKLLNALLFIGLGAFLIIVSLGWLH